MIASVILVEALKLGRIITFQNLADILKQTAFKIGSTYKEVLNFFNIKEQKDNSIYLEQYSTKLNLNPKEKNLAKDIAFEGYFFVF